MGIGSKTCLPDGPCISTLTNHRTSVATASFFPLDLGFFRRRLGFWVFLSVPWFFIYYLSDSVLAQMQLLEPAEALSDNKPSIISLALQFTTVVSGDHLVISGELKR